MKDDILNDLDIKDPKSYELGYLLVPFVAEGERENTVQKEIKDAILATGGKIGTEVGPIMKHLAYSIRKMSNNKYNLFRDAYFGAIRFETTPSAIDQITKSMQKSDSLIRFMIIEVAKNTEMKVRLVDGADKKEADLVDGVEIGVVEAVGADEQAIDKEIDDLLVTSL
ncbi:MAG: 30S ribosomal protein S6 [Patescibacteria group bacterium]